MFYRCSESNTQCVDRNAFCTDEGEYYPSCARRNNPQICYSCPKQTPVKCKGKNYKCIEEKKICDGIYDCPELEDEHNCTQCQRMYNLGKQKCLGENCMYIEKVMNKNVECWKNL